MTGSPDVREIVPLLLYICHFSRVNEVETQEVVGSGRVVVGFVE